MRSRQKTNVKVILYRSKKLADGQYPLMIRVSKNSVRKYRSTGLSCRLEHWDLKKQEPKANHPNYDSLNSLISKTTDKYHDQILEFKRLNMEFSASKLIDAVENEVRVTRVMNFFDTIIQRYIDSGQIGNAEVYKDTKRSLMSFHSNSDLIFE